MPKININKIIYTIRHKYLTFNNLVIAAAFLIAAGWVWGSLEVMQRNYGLQKEVDFKRQQLELAQLQKDNLELQNRYYQTNEYKELELRKSLGLVMPGESLLILPDNSEEVLKADAAPQRQVAVATQEASNFEQWLNFLFGGNSQSLQSNNQSDEAN